MRPTASPFTSTPSYRRCARRIVCVAPNPSLRDASCCRGEGAQGLALDVRDRERVAGHQAGHRRRGGGLGAEVELVELAAVEMGQAGAEGGAGGGLEFGINGPVFLRLLRPPLGPAAP